MKEEIESVRAERLLIGDNLIFDDRQYLILDLDFDFKIYKVTVLCLNQEIDTKNLEKNTKEFYFGPDLQCFRRKVEPIVDVENDYR